jgi:Dolichyl-phosphate-mannose-protein mannosyltransferase
MGRICTASTKALLVMLFSLNVYQAARLSILPEEANAYVRFVQPRIREVVREYDPRNQVLNTLLIKRTVGLFRLSEFSFRLPAVLAVGFYFWAVYRVSRRLFGSGPVFVIAVAVLVLNPLVQGHLWAAGGDAIGLALWMWGLERLISGKGRDWNVAGLLLGLSVAASFGFVLPSLVLMGAWLAWARERWLVVDRVILTSVAAAFVLLAVPFSRADSGTVDFHIRLPAKAPQESGVRGRFLAVRAANINTVVAPELIPSFEFYRARYRLRSWKIGPNGEVETH